MRVLDSKKTKTIMKIILIMCIFLSIALTGGERRSVSFGESLLSKILYIPQGLVIHVSHLVTSDEVFFENIDELKTENEKLKQKIKELNEELIDYEIVKEENKTLKIERDTANTYETYNVEIANVIAASNNNWEEIFLIDKGSNSGIKPYMPVITKDGLVGYVLSCDNNTSKILAIIDATSSVSARATKTREEVLVKGSNLTKNQDKIVVSDIPVGIIYESGDSFETSGLGGIYPKGIKIGTVVQFVSKPNPLENTATLQTAVDFNKLENVAIIVSFKEDNNEEIVS